MMLPLQDIQSVDTFSIIEGAKPSTIPNVPGVLMKVGGVFQRADTKNANKRVYSEKLWDKVLNDGTIQERITKRGMFGEADHPSGGETSIDRVSHVVTALQKRPDKTIYGEAEVMDTPRGRIVATLIGANCRLGVSSRGDGSVENRDGTDHVSEKDFGLDTFDFVISPSTEGAYPAPLTESAVQNEQAILVALDEHVNKAAQQGDVESLVECHQIINSSFEATAHPALRDQVLSHITEHLHKDDRNINSSTVREDELMEKGERTPTSGTVTEAQYAQRRLEETEQKLVVASEQIVSLTQHSGELQERLDAAQKLIEQYGKDFEGLNAKVDKLRQRARSTSRQHVESTQASGDLTTRHEAALSLIEELTKQVTDLTEKLQVALRDYEAAEILLAEFVSVTEQSGTATHIEKLIAGHKQADALREALKGCQTVKEADDRFTALKPLIEDGVRPGRRRSPKEPLPTATGQKVIESKKTALRVVEGEGTDGGKSALISRIVDKCGS